MEVVLAHAADQYPFPRFFDGLISNANAALVFFFVLSGFVLTYAYVRSADGRMETSRRRFWYSRFARAAPNYYLSIVMIAPFLLYGFFVAGTISAARLGITIGAVLTCLPALFAPDVLAWNPPAWSLGVETCLYAAFPFMIGPCFRWPLRSALLTSLALLAVSLTARLALLQAASSSEPWTLFVFHFPAFYFPHFMLGIIVGRWFLYGPKVSDQARMVIFAGSLASIVIIAAVNKLEWMYSDIVFAPLSAAIIFSASSTAIWPARMLALPIFVFFGEATYAIYILHWPLRLWWSYVTRAVSLPVWIDCCLYFSLVIIAALLAFYLVERPMRAYLLRLARLIA